MGGGGLFGLLVGGCEGEGVGGIWVGMDVVGGGGIVVAGGFVFGVVVVGVSVGLVLVGVVGK